MDEKKGRRTKADLKGDMRVVYPSLFFSWDKDIEGTTPKLTFIL